MLSQCQNLAQKHMAQMQFYLVINSLNLISYFSFWLKRVKWEKKNVWDFFFSYLPIILEKQIILTNGRLFFSDADSQQCHFSNLLPFSHPLFNRINRSAITAAPVFQGCLGLFDFWPDVLGELKHSKIPQAL